jgi:hypothetical protein
MRSVLGPIDGCLACSSPRASGHGFGIGPAAGYPMAQLAVGDADRDLQLLLAALARAT